MTNSISNNSVPDGQVPAPVKRGFSGIQLSLIVLLVMVITALVTFFVLRYYVFPADLKPVTLSAKEEQRLDNKLRKLGWQPASKTASGADSMEPEAYSEADQDREVTFSEKEVNSLIANNPDFARRVAIDLSDDLASAKILIPIPEDFPFMPGKTLRVNAGLELRLDDTRKPVVSLRGVSLMGVPVPNAWLGNLKNVDMVSQFGDKGFWKSFADGVDDLQVRDGELYIKLKE